MRRLVIHFVDKRPNHETPPADDALIERVFRDLSSTLVHRISGPGPAIDMDQLRFIRVGNGIFRLEEISCIMMEDVPTPIEQLAEEVGDIDAEDTNQAQEVILCRNSG